MYNKDFNYLKNTLVWKTKHLQKGERIMYEGEEAEIVSLKPLFVIKTENRVVCGAFSKRCDYLSS